MAPREKVDRANHKKLNCEQWQVYVTGSAKYDVNAMM